MDVSYWTFKYSPGIKISLNKQNISYSRFLILNDSFNSQTFVLQIGGGHNINAVVTKVAVSTIKESRQLRLQPFNEYRKRFNLKPYTSFRQFTSKKNLFCVQTTQHEVQPSNHVIYDFYKSIRAAEHTFLEADGN